MRHDFQSSLLAEKKLGNHIVNSKGDLVCLDSWGKLGDVGVHGEEVMIRIDFPFFILFMAELKEVVSVGYFHGLQIHLLIEVRQHLIWDIIVVVDRVSKKADDYA